MKKANILKQLIYTARIYLHRRKPAQTERFGLVAPFIPLVNKYPSARFTYVEPTVPEGLKHFYFLRDVAAAFVSEMETHADTPEARRIEAYCRKQRLAYILPARRKSFDDLRKAIEQSYDAPVYLHSQAQANELKQIFSTVFLKADAFVAELCHPFYEQKQPKIDVFTSENTPGTKWHELGQEFSALRGAVDRCAAVYGLWQLSPSSLPLQIKHSSPPSPL